MFKEKKNILLLIILGIQVIFFTVWVIMENSKLTDPKSKEILVQVLPVDPRDFISGNYFILRYEFNSRRFFKTNQIKNNRFPRGTNIYSILEKEGKYYKPKYIDNIKPQKIKENQIVIKGKISKYNRLEYGIEKYFINENTKEPNPRKDKIEVLLIVDENFTARIKKLYVNGKEFDQSKYQKKKK